MWLICIGYLLKRGLCEPEGWSMKHVMDTFEKTIINATGRVLRNDDNTFQYEIVVGILPIDDIVRFDSNKFNTSKDCLISMFTNYSKQVTKLLGDYEP